MINRYSFNNNMIINVISDNDSNIGSFIKYPNSEQKNIWNHNNLSINNNISFQVESSYDNFNLLSGNKLINSKFLQNKLKSYLIEEIRKVSSTLRNSLILKFRKKPSLESPVKKNDGKEFIFVCPSKRQSSPILHSKTPKIKANNKILINTIKIKNDESESESVSQNKNDIKHSFSLKEKNHLKGKKERSKFYAGVEMPDIINSNIKNKKKAINQQNKNNIIKFKTIDNNFYVKNNTIDFWKKNRSKVNSLISNSLKSKKKKDDLLSKINSNIEQTNQNLNDPDKFYNNYFNDILRKSSKNNTLMTHFSEKPKLKNEKEKTRKDLFFFQ